MDQILVFDKKISAANNSDTDKSESYPWFDWLRFVLASVVVLAHANFQLATFLTGALAVNVFFALSGWLIGGVLLRAEISDLPRFFFNRATRIWIPYFVAIILLYGVAALREGVSFFWVKYLVMDVTFTHQLFTFFPMAAYEMPLKGSGNQFWSIAVEEQFYLLSPLILLFVSKGKTLFAWLLISVMTLALSSHFGSISLGVCAAILQRDYRITDRPWVRVLAMILVLGCALALSMHIAAEWPVGSLFSIALVILFAVPGRRSKLALHLGGLSYPLYLNHWLGLVLVNGSAKHLGLSELSVLPLVAYITAIVLTIPLYWIVDRNVLLHRDVWYTQKLGRLLGVVAYTLVITGIMAGVLLYQYGPHGVVPGASEAQSK